MDRAVYWISYSQGESQAGLPFMKAIVRQETIVHWQLRPVVDCIEPGHSGWLMQRGLPKGVGGHQEEFDLPSDYPWFLDSRRALQYKQKKKEAEDIFSSPYLSPE